MWGGRAPWLLLATLMSAAAAALGMGAYLHWLPCRGQLLNGSVLAGYRLSGEFSAACLARMDSGGSFALGGRLAGDPASQPLVALALVLLALAWTGFIAAQRWPGTSRAVAVLPGILTGVLAAASLAQSRGSLAAGGWIAWLTVGIDLTALLAAGVIIQHSDGTVRMGQLIGLWGIASFGWLRTLGDYAFMVGASAANWDIPPGQGFPTALIIACCGLAAAAFGLAGGARLRNPRLPAVVSPQAG